MTVPARRLVLASASPARLRLLRDARFEPEVVPSEIDEDTVGSDDPWTVVRALAIEKATVVAGRVGGDALVVGCDSMLLFDGDMLGKPRDADEAVSRWQRMRGKTGVLLTGHCVI